jgi:sensor histidine kinase YesM
MSYPDDGLVAFKPLVENAIKHGFCGERMEILISAKKKKTETWDQRPRQRRGMAN